jgi:oligopeptide transport system substrate-binding protein
LAEAGFPGGRGLPTFELQSYSDNMRLRTMEAIQARWKIELGIHITITPIEQKTLFQNQQTLNYQIGLSGWTADYPDPTTFLDTYMTGNGNNFTGWSDAAYDKLVQEAHRTADPARRFEWLQQAEARLLDQAPMAPLFFWAQVYALHPAVRGWEPSALNLHQLKNVWLEKR